MLKFNFEEVQSLKKRSRAGEACARNSLGSFYFEYHKDYKKAFRYFKLAAADGDPHGHYNVALCFEEGLGVTRNHKKAWHWYKLGAELGHSLSKKKIEVGLNLPF